MFPLALIIPALIPVVADGLRAVFNRVTNGAGAQPTTVAEAVQLMEARAKFAAAMAQLDQPAANISRWVADLRASFRYIAAGILIVTPYFLVGIMALGIAVDHDFLMSSLDGRDAAFSFIFGDRMYASFRGK